MEKLTLYLDTYYAVVDSMSVWTTNGYLSLLLTATVLISFLMIFFCGALLFLHVLLYLSPETNEDKPKPQSLTDRLLQNPKKSVPLSILVILICLYPMYKFETIADVTLPDNLYTQTKDIHNGETQTESYWINKLKPRISKALFDTYLETNQSLETVQPKESVAPSKIEHDNLYIMSFNLEGVQYNDQLIYTTYTENYPTDVLLPFDETFAKGVFQRARKGYPDIEDNYLDISYRAKNLREGYAESGLTLDQVDYIYNIKISETQPKRDL